MLCHIRIEYFDLAGRRGQGAAEHANSRGFTAAVGAEQPEDFPFFNSNIKLVDGCKITESAHQVLRLIRLVYR